MKFSPPVFPVLPEHFQSKDFAQQMLIAWPTLCSLRGGKRNETSLP